MAAISGGRSSFSRCTCSAAAVESLQNLSETIRAVSPCTCRAARLRAVGGGDALRAELLNPKS
jgi:hypothetical protein